AAGAQAAPQRPRGKQCGSKAAGELKLIATGRRRASKCQGKSPNQNLDQAVGLSEGLVAVSTSTLSCKRAGKTQTLMPVWDSSGEYRMKLFNHQRIAFVFFPHFPETIRLDTMPFAAHILSFLAASGWDIDVFLLRPEPSGAASHVPENIHFIYTRMLTRRANLQVAQLTAQFVHLTT